jgi:hypothetical protein
MTRMFGSPGSNRFSALELNEASFWTLRDLQVLLTFRDAQPPRTLLARVQGEFVLMQPLVFGINRDSVCTNDRI